MRSLYTIGGPLRWELRTQPSKVFKRYKFHGQPSHILSSKSTLLPSKPARTRFAPSPTGYLHLGSLRTALYNYLLAKATGGQFLVRIEDTDQTRIVSDAESKLYEDLKWAGLDWDEGPSIGGDFGPYKQSQRLPTYNQHASQLLDSGRAYRCFCSPAELDAIKAQNIKEGTSIGYNKTCSHIPEDVSTRRAAAGEPHCVRLRCEHEKPAPPFHDMVYGRYKTPFVPEDFILIKRDGYPTYHFANVIDDHLMQITHVIRGAEWLVSTPRHVMLYDAFGWEPPEFAHVGLLVDSNRQKLSKRLHDIGISSYREKGYLPVALLNYVALLGWSPLRTGQKKITETMDLETIISKFHLRFTRGDIRINDKLAFIQNYYLKRILAQPEYPETIQQVSNVILPNLEKAIGEVEKGRSDNPLLGPIIVPARPAEEDSNLVGKDYLRKMFEVDMKSFVDAESHVWRNANLIWEIPEESYVQALDIEMEQNTVDNFWVKHPDAAAPEGGNRPISALQDPDIWDMFDSLGRKPSKVVDLFHATVQEITDEAWTKESLEKKMKPLIMSIYSDREEHGKDRERGRRQVWGWHALRWIMVAGNVGPALIPSMELLGKAETMRRMSVAKRAALRWEQDEMKKFKDNSS
ncbi:uncharacterized protein BCR38DRAFT_520595 [Pseudomassariella vexata]|uniref:Glutamate--tRNA ligase, mitochondrial n=1 Tax=Pseudomassariella vexata TaxID=1141098 RepID=A0A1Y2EDL6_9PEZI|nr:uncharacterized protein BCR38DRAFT_520595 [Pseudomassariella vexata]ORY69668.1 hypothetical protein BCR38DRAFT_520595 [Pseudomassariella vexata]